VEPTLISPQIGPRSPHARDCVTFASVITKRLTNIGFPISSRKHLKMCGVKGVVPGTRFRESRGVPLVNWAVGGTLTAILVAMAFALGAWGGREFERREAERAGAGHYVEGEWRYIDGRSAAEYRAVAPHLSPLK